MHRAVIACQHTRSEPCRACVWCVACVCGRRRHMHWLAHTTSNSRSVALSGWMGMDRHAAFGVAGCSALAGTQPMRSCDTVQIFPSSSSSRYATLCCAVLYICGVLFCFSGYPQKKTLKFPPLVTVTVTTIPAIVYFSLPLRARSPHQNSTHSAWHGLRCKGWDKGTQPPPANRLIHNN